MPNYLSEWKFFNFSIRQGTVVPTTAFFRFGSVQLFLFPNFKETLAEQEFNSNVDLSRPWRITLQTSGKRIFQVYRAKKKTMLENKSQYFQSFRFSFVNKIFTEPLSYIISRISHILVHWFWFLKIFEIILHKRSLDLLRTPQAIGSETQKLKEVHNAYLYRY